MKLPDKEPEYGLPTVDYSPRHPVDILLRENGFSIHQRKRNKEPLWEKKGKLYRESEARTLIHYVEKFDEDD